MSKFTIIAAASGLTFIVWGIAFSRQAPTPQPQHVVESNYISLQQRWDQGQFDEKETVLAKGPRLIQTVKINPDPVEVAEVKHLEPPEQPAERSYRHRKKTRPVYSDVCSKHRMRKVYVSAHRWRCKK